MLAGVYLGQAILAWMPLFGAGGSTIPAERFTSYNAEVATFTTWQNTP